MMLLMNASGSIDELKQWRVMNIADFLDRPVVAECIHCGLEKVNVD